jgi:hypothetical protein
VPGEFAQAAAALTWEPSNSSDREFIDDWLHTLEELRRAGNRVAGSDAYFKKLAEVRESVTDDNAKAIRCAVELMDMWNRPAVASAFDKYVAMTDYTSDGGKKSGEARRIKAEKKAAKPSNENIFAAAWRQWSKHNDSGTLPEFIEYAEGGYDFVAHGSRWRVTSVREGEKVTVTVRAFSGTAVRPKPSTVDMKTLRRWCA